MKDIKIAATELSFISPKYLDHYEKMDHTVISGSCTPAQVDALLCGVLIYNQICPTDSAENDLGELCRQMSENDAVMSGGVVFIEDSRKILPQCCCGMEQWSEIISDIMQGKSPWLGHDPTAFCTFDTDGIKVHSDNPEIRNPAFADRKYPEIFTINYSWTEFEQCAEQMKDDMNDFVAGPLRKRINELVTPLTDKFCFAWQNCFGWRE